MAAGDDHDNVTAQARVRTPLLAIFPGTTAGHAALEFMRQALELPESDRQRIALVHVDIDHLHPELVEFRSRHPGLFPTEKVIRIGVPRHVAHIGRIEQDGDPTEPHTYIDPKLPDAYENGARGIRNNGHVAFCHNASMIEKELTEAVTQITSREANQGLPQATAVQVQIVCFVGGGTASGMAADLACLARQLLVAGDLDPRLNLTCILPTGVSSDDADLRRSNAVACMLEILALSQAHGAGGGRYRKYVRARPQELAPGPIVHEVYLVGSANMTEPRDIARIAGMDLFQRALDASGVGALERSEAVNRISLGSQDDRGLPTMFGTSCPLEARFPVGETALAFARMAASHVLPLLAGYRPAAPQVAPSELEAFRKTWQQVAQIQATSSSPLGVRVPELFQRAYRQIDGARADRLWVQVQEAERTITQRVETVAAAARREQEARIEGASGGAPEERERRWQLLQREYEVALEDVRKTELRNLTRPQAAEQRAMRWWWRGPGERQLYRSHRGYLLSHAQNERRRQLEPLLVDLQGRVGRRIEYLRALAQRANADRQTPALRQRATGSPAWRAKLDPPHPFQVHVLDLAALGCTDGASPAVEQLYRWATEHVMTTVDDGSPNYGRFLPEIAARIDVERPDQDAERLSRAVVGFLEPMYRRRLEEATLLELIEHAVPEDRQRSGAREVAESAVAELMTWLATRMTSLVTFDERIGGEQGTAALKTEVFLGAGVPAGEERRIRDAATRAGLLRTGADHYRHSFDPHRLQVSYQQHGISLAAIYDFFSPINSAMERYLRFMRAWHDPDRPGSPPPHSCGELEWQVAAQRLVERLVRSVESGNGRAPQDPPDGRGAALPATGRPLS